MTSNTPVLIGPLPPPVHGSSVVTQDLFEIMGRHGPSEVVDSAASRHLTSIGKLHAKGVLRSLRTIAAVARILRDRRRVVYLAPSQIGPALVRDLALWMIAATRTERLYIHVHGCGFHRLGTSGPLLRRFLVRRLGRRTHFILLSERYHALFLTGFPSVSQVHYLPNAISPAAERIIAKQSVSTGNGSVVRLLYIGAISRVKILDGLEAIVKSTSIVEALKRVGKQLEITIAGELRGRPAQQQIDRLLAEATDPIGVSYIGGVFDLERKGRLFASADCFICPTVHPTEGLPVTLIEALCASTPIIAFDTGLCGDAVDDSNGWLVRSGNMEALQESVIGLIACHAENGLQGRRVASRRLFESRFTHELFEERACRILRVHAGPEQSPPQSLRPRSSSLISRIPRE